MLTADVKDVRVGTAQAKAVYVGTEKVWPLLTWSPTALSGSVLALEATDVLAGPVTTWLDRSPTANHMVVRSGTPVATGGYVSFTHLKTMVSTGLVPMANMEPRHLIVLMRARTAEGPLMGYGAAALGALFDLYIWTGKIIFHGYGGGQWNTTGSNPPVLPLNAWVIVELSFDGTTIDIKVDDSSPSFRGMTISTAPATMILGDGRYREAYETADFDVAALYFYNRKLSEADRQQVKTYLREKWGLS